MQMANLVPLSQCAKQYGVKCLAHGGPGTGKTPLLKTAPRPIVLLSEPGAMSVRDAHNIPAHEAYTVKAIKEFFDWFFSSHESRNFDTLIWDSVSQAAEIVLSEEMPKHKDPRKAYGEMSRTMMDWCSGVYFQQQKHAYLTSKQIIAPIGGVATRKYFFPGQDLNVKIPHLYDEILCVGHFIIPGAGPNPIRAIQCQPSFDVVARDRSGKLAQYEPPDLTALFAKCMT